MVYIGTVLECIFSAFTLSGIAEWDALQTELEALDTDRLRGTFDPERYFFVSWIGHSVLENSAFHYVCALAIEYNLSLVKLIEKYHKDCGDLTSCDIYSFYLEKEN